MRENIFTGNPKPPDPPTPFLKSPLGKGIMIGAGVLALLLALLFTGQVTVIAYILGFFVLAPLLMPLVGGALLLMGWETERLDAHMDAFQEKMEARDSAMAAARTPRKIWFRVGRWWFFPYLKVIHPNGWVLLFVAFAGVAMIYLRWDFVWTLVGPDNPWHRVYLYGLAWLITLWWAAFLKYAEWDKSCN